MSGTLAFFRVVLLEHYGATLNRLEQFLLYPCISMYILEHVRIHPLDSFPGDTNRNDPPFSSHAMVRSPDPPMVKSQEPLEVNQWMSQECRVLSLVLGPTSHSLKDVDLNMAAKPVKYGQKLICILLISMESFSLNTLSLRFGDTKWEKSIEHHFFWPHLTALNVVSICSLCTSRIYTASVEGVGWCCGQSLAKKRCKCSAKLLRRDVELFPYYIITTCS